MKNQLRHVVLTSILMFHAFNNSILAQWTNLNTGVTNDLNGVSFINSANGWIVGRQGTILSTIDNGINWLAQNSGTTEDLQAIHMINSSVGYAVGKNGKISKYNGTNWTAVNTGESMDVFGVYFLNANSGWAVGDWGRLYYTSNGGSSWTNQNTNGFAAYKYNDIQMLDASTGWAVGTGGRIVKFNGSIWNPQTSGTTTELLGVHFLNSTFGFAVGKNSTILFYNGTSWISQNSGLGNSNDNIYDVHIISPTEAYAVVSPGFGGAGVILKYNGNTWVKDYEFSGIGSELFYGLHFPENSKGFVVGAGGILKTVSLTVSNVGESSAKPFGIKIYQNSNEELVLETNYYKNALVEIYTTDGKLVKIIEPQSSKTNIQVKPMVNGIYFLRIMSPEGISTKKFVLE